MTSLPSPPTSPRARIRVNRPGSLSIPPMSPSSIVSPDPDTPGSEIRSITLASPSVVAAKRRQPSITYYTPSSPSPSSQRPQSHRTLSCGLDGEPALADGKENASKRSSLVLSSRSPSTRESVSSLDGAGAREREPLTLAEKHADLLHFIAQKERKCLELRDQLAAHERELAELKRKWERIINRGHDPLPNSPLTAGIGGAALGGLKEGVRMIAAGFSDLGGATNELEPSDKDFSKPHAPRENANASNARTKQTGNEHLSTNSMSSIPESVDASNHVLDGGEGEMVAMAMAVTVATAPSLARATSLNNRVHKRASRTIAKQPTTPPSVSVSPPAQSPRSSNLDVGTSLVLTPSPTLVPFPSSAAPTPAPVAGSAHGPVPMNAGPMSSWMDNMGKKLSGIQKGQTFSKSQKRASSLLAGVSNTLSSALSPGPTPTTPAPAPFPMPATRILSTTIPSSTSPVSTKSSLTTRPPSPQPQPQSRPQPSYKTMTDWLDDDEEQTVHAGGVLVPDAKRQPHPVRTTAAGRGETAVTAVSSFDDDDDWNW